MRLPYRSPLLSLSGLVCGSFFVLKLWNIYSTWQFCCHPLTSLRLLILQVLCYTLLSLKPETRSGPLIYIHTPNSPLQCIMSTNTSYVECSHFPWHKSSCKGKNVSVSFKSVSKALCLFVPLKTFVDGYPPLYLCTREIQPLPKWDLESSGWFHPFSLNWYSNRQWRHCAVWSLCTLLF